MTSATSVNRTGPTNSPPICEMFNSIDDVAHQRTRLGLLCVLSTVDERDFNGLRRDLKLSDGNLARHITVLRAADLVDADQRLTPNHRRRTFLRLTELGRRTLAAELTMLAAVVSEYTADLQSITGQLGA